MLANVGRKPKPNDRFPCGKARPDAPEAIIATALAPRLRAGISYEEAVVRNERGVVVGASQDAGHTLGLLRLRGRQSDPGGISEAQFNAGWQYGGIIKRHASIMGYSLGSPKSPGFEMVAGGMSCAEDPQEELILDIRRRWSDCYRALMDAGKDLGVGTRVATTTYDTCCDRVLFVELQADRHALGNLKIGLNSLARVLR